MKVVGYCGYSVEEKRWCLTMSAFLEYLRSALDYEIEKVKFGDFAFPEGMNAAVTIGWKKEYTSKVHAELLRRGIPFLAISDGFLKREVDWTNFLPGMVLQGSKADGYEPHYCVSRNGIGAYGEHAPIGDLPSDRWEALDFDLKPWREKGEYILIAHQNILFAADGTDRANWFINTIRKLSEITDMKMIIRPHPKLQIKERLPKTFVKKIVSDAGIPNGRLVLSENTLAEDLKGTWALVTYDSAAAVDSVLHGVPAICGGKSMASSVASDQLESVLSPPTPDRKNWCDWLAYSQWTVKELSSGKPWSLLMEGLCI